MTSPPPKLPCFVCMKSPCTCTGRFSISTPAMVHKYLGLSPLDLPSGKNVPVERRDEPVRGWKAARLHILPDDMYEAEVRFMGSGVNATYKAEDTARCVVYDENDISAHEAPDLRCSTKCGFWAVKQQEHVQATSVAGGSWLLEVELAGTVHEGKLGYRGSWQRVLSVTAPLWCRACKNPGRFLVNTTGNMLAVSCADHAGDAVIPDPRRWLAAKLGTEVRGEFLGTGPAQVAAQPSRPFELDARHLASILTREVVRQATTLSQTPGLVPGRAWRYFIQGDPALLVELSVAGALTGAKTLAIIISEVHPDKTFSIRMQDTIPL